MLIYGQTGSLFPRFFCLVIGAISTRTSDEINRPVVAELRFIIEPSGVVLVEVADHGDSDVLGPGPFPEPILVAFLVGEDGVVVLFRAIKLSAVVKLMDDIELRHIIFGLSIERRID